MAICAIARITVTATTIAMWLKHRMERISSRDPYLSSRKVLTNPAAPSNSEMTLRYLSLFFLWLGPIISFYTAFHHDSSYFFSLMWAMVGHSLALLLLSVLHHYLQFGLELEHISPGKSRYCICTGEGQWILANYSHWVEPQTVEYYIADVYLILLCDHNDSFSKYNKKNSYKLQL